MKKTIILLIIIIMVSTLFACSKEIVNGKLPHIYPAFKIEKNKKMWGYIDPKGKFVVEPKYDKTYDFSSEGLAKVEKDGLSGVINRQGKEILEPEYQMIFDFINGYFVVFNGMENQIFNYEGDLQFSGKDKYIHIGPYSDGLFTVATMDEDNEIKMGYMDNIGTLTIQEQYTRAYDFIDGKAIVQENEDDRFKIIDKENKLVKELDYKEVRSISSSGLYIFKGKSELYGLLDSNGNVIIEDEFKGIEKIEGDHILVNVSEDGYGVIDKKSEYVIKPEYRDVILLGDGYFALSKDLDKDENNIYAIGNSKGELITESKYYNVGGSEGKIRNGLISVYDGENTYVIDSKGEKLKNVPVVFGPGEISFDGDIAKVNISGKRSYFKANGELLWEENNTYSLVDEAAVLEERYLERKIIDIRYPVVVGFENKEVEDKINERLYEEFRKSYDLGQKIDIKDYKSYKIDYNVNMISDLLLVEQRIKVIRKKGSKSMVSKKIYNIDLTSGRFYELKDLFKENSGYMDILTDIVRGIAEEKNSRKTEIYDLINWKGVRADQDFIVYEDTIDIYFNSNEIFSHSEEIPRFTIKQDSIDDILDLNLEFWKAYEGR